MEIIGIVVFAVGILVSVCLHEAGHLGTAKAFGMKATRYFVGFGPTLWSFRRGETEYGLKAIPLGGFVKIVGMTPQDDDVEPGDEARAMWRFSVWKRTIVMAAGSISHFVLGIAILWALFAFVALPDRQQLEANPVTIETVAGCTAPTWEFDRVNKVVKECVEGVDPSSVAKQMGLQPGDVVTAVDGQSVVGWTPLTNKIRAAGGKTVTITVLRDGQTITQTATLPVAKRPKLSVITDPTKTAEQVTPADLEDVGVLGITPVIPVTVAGPVHALGRAGRETGNMVTGAVGAIKQFPQKLPNLWAALTGAEARDPSTPMSMVGASRIGGELFREGEFPTFLLILAGLNFFVGMFNLLPLLPLDGGHIAIAWFEKARSWVYARLGRPDPGRVDYYKLMPVTYAVILLFGGLTLLTVAADIVSPITLF